MSHIDELRLILARTGYQDLDIALQQIVGMQLGREYPRDERHPVTDEIRATGASFQDIAGILTDRSYAGRRDLTPGHIKMAITSSELSNAFDAQMAQAMTTATSDYIGRVTRLVREITVDSLQETQSPHVSANDFDAVPQGGEIPMARATYGGEPVKVASYPQNLMISAESLLIGDRWNIVQATIDAIAQAGGRHVNAAMVALLGSNPTVGGKPLFGSDNDLTPAALSAASLSLAFKALAEQPTTHADENEGENGVTGIEAVNLIVPPDIEAEAHVLASDLAPSKSLTVTALPTLDGAWYVTGSKANSPWVMAKMSESPINTQRIPEQSQPLEVGDGISYRTRLEYDLKFANRQIVRTALS